MTPEVDLIQTEEGIMLAIGAPIQDGAQLSSLRVKMRVSQGMVPAQPAATADEIHAWFASGLSAGGPFDYSVRKRLTKRSVVR